MGAKSNTHPYGLTKINIMDSYPHLSPAGMGTGSSSFTHYLNEGHLEHGYDSKTFSMMDTRTKANMNGFLPYQNKMGFPPEAPHNSAFHLPTNKSISLDNLDVYHESRPPTSNYTPTSVLNKPKVVLPSIKRIFDECEQQSYNISVTESGEILKRRKSLLFPTGRIPSGSPVNTFELEKKNTAENEICDESKSEDSFFTKKAENRCSTCSKTFKKPSTLKRHLITHTDSKPFVCTYCGRGFNVKHNLVRHNKRHDEISKQAAVNILITNNNQE